VHKVIIHKEVREMKRNAKNRWNVPHSITRRKFDQLPMISTICHCHPTKPSHYKATSEKVNIDEGSNQTLEKSKDQIKPLTLTT
jgi:hypothetical protein